MEWWRKFQDWRLRRQIRKHMDRIGINPTLGYCTECDEYYNVANKEQYDKHTHK